MAGVATQARTKAQQCVAAAAAALERAGIAYMDAAVEREDAALRVKPQRRPALHVPFGADDVARLLWSTAGNGHVARLT